MASDANGCLFFGMGLLRFFMLSREKFHKNFCRKKNPG